MTLSYLKSFRALIVLFRAGQKEENRAIEKDTVLKFT